MPIPRRLEPEVMDSPQDADDYDQMDHSKVNRVFVVDLMRAIGKVLPLQDIDDNSEWPPTDVLDLGTGTAQIPIALCNGWADCRVMAVDAATSMLDLARYNVEAAGLTERIQLARVDAKSLPYPDGMFDVVMSNSIVHHIPDPLAVLREAVRVTKPGRLVFVRDLLRPDTEEQLQHLVSTYAADCNDRQRQLFADSLHAALSLDEVRGLVAQLGFAAETVQQTSDRHWTWSATHFPSP